MNLPVRKVLCLALFVVLCGFSVVLAQDQPVAEAAAGDQGLFWKVSSPTGIRASPARLSASSGSGTVLNAALIVRVSRACRASTIVPTSSSGEMVHVMVPLASKEGGPPSLHRKDRFVTSEVLKP